MTKRIPKVALGMPARDIVALETTHCLINLVGRVAQKYIATNQMEWATITVAGTLLPQMRNSIVEEAIKLDCTHLLWVDSDMKFPADSLERLMSHRLPVVGANYAQRKRPSKPTAAREGADGQKFWIYGREKDAPVVEPVDFLGAGLMLVEVAVYKALPKPWYMVGWAEERQCIVGEDVHFCRMLPEIGVRPHVDHGLSEHVHHVGVHHYTMQDARDDAEEVIRIQRETGEAA